MGKGKSKNKEQAIPNDIHAVIALALMEYEGLANTGEPTKLTIKRTQNLSTWALKSHTMRQMPEYKY